METDYGGAKYFPDTPKVKFEPDINWVSVITADSDFRDQHNFFGNSSVAFELDGDGQVVREIVLGAKEKSMHPISGMLLPYSYIEIAQRKRDGTTEIFPPKYILEQERSWFS